MAENLPSVGEGTDTMRIYDRDYRYLLLHIVPQHRLPPDLRRDVDHALRSGDEVGLRRESVRAMEALVASAYFERTGVRTENGAVVVGYRKRGGRYQVSMAVPRSEWHDPDTVPADVPALAPEPPVTLPTAPPAAPAGAPSMPSLVSATSPDVLPDILRSFAITDRSAPILDRLELLLGTLERWLGFSALSLDVVDEVLLGGGAGGTRVRVVTDAELRESELVRRAIESGARRLVPRANLVPTPRDSGASWDVMGVAPIYATGKVVGALRAGFPGSIDRARMDANLETAGGVVRHMIEFHVQFESMTSVDALTGVYNRQFMDRQLPVEIERAMRSGSALSMLVIDVDDFKRVNDELGHKKGDEALIAVAEIIRRNLRKVDLAFRYGGEEIVILLPGTPEFEAVHTAERLRRVIQQYRGFRDTHGNTREITVSVGVSVYPDTARTAEQLFLQADEAMYRAKQRGKNQVVLYSTA